MSRWDGSHSRTPWILVKYYHLDYQRTAVRNNLLKYRGGGRISKLNTVYSKWMGCVGQKGGGIGGVVLVSYV